MGSRILTVSGVWTRIPIGKENVKVPFIRLQGKWVEKLGFKVGSKVMVSKGAGELTIRLLKEDLGQ